MDGLLIINADDWGLDASTTDAIARCAEAGGVTSTSGMVWMTGSRAAASRASELGLPVGLHINLTEPLSDPAVPADARERQARIVRHFAGPAHRRWGLRPTLFAEIERCVAEQLEEFRALYGREPTHLDGHEHIHQSLGVLLARTLPSGAAMRPSFTFPAGEKSWANRGVRAAVNALMGTRFRSPRYLFSLRDMHPALGGAGIEEKLALAGGSCVEVMTHPGWEDERAILLDGDWTALIGLRVLGDYRQLSARTPPLRRLRGDGRPR